MLFFCHHYLLSIIIVSCNYRRRLSVIKARQANRTGQNISSSDSSSDFSSEFDNQPSQSEFRQENLANNPMYANVSINITRQSITLSGIPNRNVYHQPSDSLKPSAPYFHVSDYSTSFSSFESLYDLKEVPSVYLEP